MNLSEFRIGSDFVNDGARWRCTDVGTRVVIAICVDEAPIARKPPGEPTTSWTIPEAEAEAIGWFVGPPYDVVEYVFDERDRMGCAPI